MDYQNILAEIWDTLKSEPNTGKIATYIPELAKVGPDKFGISLTCLDGSNFSIGDAEEQFSIQSVSKVLTLSLAIRLIGDKVWERVDVEPSGDPFNSLVQLEYENGIPRNPLINAGALVIADILISKLEDPKKDFLKFVRNIGGSSAIDFNKKVAASEKATGFRNAALANFIKSFGNLENDVEEVLDFYFYQCSLTMSCLQLSRTFLLFANQGYCLETKNSILTSSQVKRINAIMQTCGFYDEAG